MQRNKSITNRAGQTCLARDAQGLRLGLGVAIVLMALVAFATPQRTTFAQTTAWSSPVRLGPESLSAWFPDVTVDSSGMVHVVFAASGAEGGDQYFDMVKYLSLRDGQVVNAVVDVQATVANVSASYAARPRITVGREGNLHMTWRDIGGIYYTRAPLDTAFMPAHWRPNQHMNEGYFSQVLQDKQGRLHLFLTDNVVSAECKNCFHLYYYQSNDDGASWSPQKDISVFSTGAAKPSVVIDANENIHVAWEMGRGGDLGQLSRPTKIAYTASYDNGQNWTTPITFVPGDARTEARNPALAIDGKGNLLLTWMGLTDDYFYYQVSADEGRAWSAPQRISGAYNTLAILNSVLDSQAMDTDSAGNVHLVAVGRTALEQRTLNVLHFQWNGAIWSQPDVIATIDTPTTSDAPQWPRIAVGSGNQLHVVWYLRREALKDTEDPPPYHIYYSHATANAPAIAAQPVPTLAPTKTPAPLATLVVAPTLAPGRTLSEMQRDKPGAEGLQEGLRTETDQYLRLGLSLLPALALMGAVLLIARARRR
jgi:hypothetical protein